MTALSWSSVIEHSTDAGFRAWGSELSSKLAAVGLVQTADTGQINWTTVVRPVTAALAGYEIWRTADSSMFFKISYGSNSSTAGFPRIDMQFGTGSNGSGTLLNPSVAVTCSNSTSNITAGAASSASPSYISASNDHLTLVWKVGSVSAGVGPSFFAIAKTVDAAGAYTNEGVAMVYVTSASQSSILGVRWSAPIQQIAANVYWSLAAGNLASTGGAGNIQIYPTWMANPEMRPFMGISLFRLTEITGFNTYTVQMVGSVNKTYLAVPPAGNNYGFLQSALYGMGFLYE